MHRTRLEEIRNNLKTRIIEAKREGWLGENEGLQISLTGANDKITQINTTQHRTTTTELVIPHFANPSSTHHPYQGLLMTPTHLATALRAHAQGIYCLQAATELLITQPWLHRTDFTSKFITITPSLTNGQAIAVIDWRSTITALDTDNLPCSGSEQRILRITASIADGIPVDLRDSLTGIDNHNIQLLLQAVLHASGRRPSPQTP